MRIPKTLFPCIKGKKINVLSFLISTTIFSAGDKSAFNASSSKILFFDFNAFVTCGWSFKSASLKPSGVFGSKGGVVALKYKSFLP